MNQVNEKRQLVVEFTSLVQQLGRYELYPFGPETHLFLALEQEVDSNSTWIVVNPPDWNYSNFNALCCDRAWRAEAGELLLDGKRVIAESYLKAWRSAMANPISFPKLLQLGFSLTAVISKPTAFCAAAVEAKSDDRFIQHLSLNSPLISERNKERITWTIPIVDVTAIKIYNDLRTGYWRESDYPGTFGTSWHVTAPVGHASTAPADYQQPELFAEAA